MFDSNILSYPSLASPDPTVRQHLIEVVYMCYVVGGLYFLKI